MQIEMKSHSFGFTLFEVMISLLILSVLLLGLDAMQLIALHKAKESYYFSVATTQLNSMVERLRLSKGEYLSDQLIRWNHQNREVLPEGYGKVRGYYPNVELEIFWGSQTVRSCHSNKIGKSGCLHIAIKS